MRQGIDTSGTVSPVASGGGWMVLAEPALVVGPEPKRDLAAMMGRLFPVDYRLPGLERGGPSGFPEWLRGQRDPSPRITWMRIDGIRAYADDVAEGRVIVLEIDCYFPRRRNQWDLEEWESAQQEITCAADRASVRAAYARARLALKQAHHAQQYTLRPGVATC